MADMVQDVRNLFCTAFGSSPAAIARAPGRVEVLGNHTDYNEGFVLSCAIDKEIYVAAGPGTTNGVIELVSSQYPDRIVSITASGRIKDLLWANYPLGVLTFLREAGMSNAPVRLAIHGNVPLGAGLSSSAALEVATGLALSTLFNFAVEPTALAKICQRAEHEFAGSKCGLLDQFSSIFGKKDHVLFIDFRTLQHRNVPLADHDLELVLSISGVSHSLVESAYNDRRQECFEAARYFREQDPAVKTLRDISMTKLLSAEGRLNHLFLQRAKHVVGENERVLEGIQLLEKGDLAGFGALLFQSHESSRINFENSCPELDTLVEIARSSPGVFGSRLSGGGFGGATLSFVKATEREQFIQSIITGYNKAYGRKATVYSARSADGASIISN